MADQEAEDGPEDEKERVRIAARKPSTSPALDVRRPGGAGQDDNRAVIAEFSYTHSGQFPDPYTLQGYKQVDPDLIPTIIAMAKAEAQHRQDMERMVKQTGARRSTWGMTWGGLLGGIDGNWERYLSGDARMQ